MDDLRCHVLDCAEGRVAAVVVAEGDLAEAKVGEQEVALPVEKTVLGLQVAVQNADVLVQVLKRKYHFRHVEGRGILLEHALHRKVGEQLAPLGVLENQVELLVVLEGVEELDDKWMAVHAFQHHALGLGLLHKLLVHGKGGLSELLLGIQLSSDDMADQQDCSERALAETEDRLKVVGGHLAAELASHVHAIGGGSRAILLGGIRTDEVMVQGHFVAGQDLGLVAVGSNACIARGSGATNAGSRGGFAGQTERIKLELQRTDTVSYDGQGQGARAGDGRIGARVGRT